MAKPVTRAADAVVNPDLLDIAPNFKIWLWRFFHGYCHVTYAGLITWGIGFYVALAFHIIVLQVVGLVLVALGTSIAVEQAAHLFTN